MKHRTNKGFTLHFRYREDGIIGPIDYRVDIQAPSMKEAKAIGKSWEGREPRMRWLYSVDRLDEATK